MHTPCALKCLKKYYPLLYIRFTNAAELLLPLDILCVLEVLMTVQMVLLVLVQETQEAQIQL